MVNIAALVMIILGTVMGIGTIYLIKGSYNPTYDTYIQALEGNDYFLKSIYGIGYFFLDKIGIDFNSHKFHKKEKKIAEVKGQKFAKFYMVANYAGMISYISIFFTFGLLLGGLTGELSIALIAIMLGGFLAFYLFYTNNKIVEDRHEKIMEEFPHLLSKMALLINAGMPLREAIEVSIKGNNSILAQEFEQVINDMNNGSSDIEAMLKMGSRCEVSEVKKLTSLIVQNLQKGSTELGKNLMDMSSEIWQERVGSVKELGEKASGKLLIPIMIIFLGILLMVIVPFFSSLSI